MHLACFVLQQRSVDDNLFLAASEYLAAGQIKGRIFAGAAGIAEQACFGQGEDHPADPGPIDRPGTHGARFGAGVQGAAGELCFTEKPGRLTAGDHLSMLGGVAGRADRIVSSSDDSLSPLVHDQGAKGMPPVLPRGSRQLNCLPQENQVLFRYFAHG